MQHPTRNLTPVVALLSIAVLFLGSGCTSPNGGSNTGGSGGTAGSGGAGGAGGTGGSGGSTIAGTYVELFSCQLDDGTCLEVNVRIEMDVTDLGDGQYRIDDRGSNATTTSARLVGDALEWRSVDPDFPGFVERGLWTFDFSSTPTTFVKESVFGQSDGSMGECVGNGISAGGREPDPPPAFMPPCIPQ